MPACANREVPLEKASQTAATYVDEQAARRFIDEDVVISGMSGRFPDCANIEEYRQKLIDNVDMINDEPTRWQKGLYGLPERMGKLKEENVVHFDANFFGVHHKQADCMDPQMRLLLEATHEAIVDAGYNPAAFRGSKTGVYLGVHTSECEQYWIQNPDRINGYGLTGCTRSMFANRISFTFDFRGPSYCLDTACSSSMYALEQAFADMRTGKCDAAIVGGSNMCLKPGMSLQFFKLKMINSDGKCKVFNEDADGYCRSEALVVLFLQRTSQARRIYATILNARTNADGYTEKGITYPDSEMQNRLLRESYAEIGLDPLNTSYVEAHGTGTKVGDPEEVNSICKFFCEQRKEALPIGSVKSNMGHSESASGVCGIVKVLLAMEMGLLPANLHFTKPNPALHGLFNGRLEVVAKNRPWSGGIASLNSFGFGGANAHVILKSNPKQKPAKPSDLRPKLVVCSGRTFDAVQNLLNDATTHVEDDEYLGLLNTIHATPIAGHDYRGYAVLGDQGILQCEVLELNETKRPIWFIYSGMGSQWASMAKDLMHLEVFSKSIARSCAALRAEGVELMDVLLHSNEQTFEEILNSFVGIAAMQVALTDVLRALGIEPDGMVGHSVGELGCAYADGCFSPEQMVLAAYWRGKSVVDTELPSGKMAAVGLSSEAAQQRLPSDVYAVCHNSADNCTISGPVAAVDAIIAQFNAEGIFAKAVNSSGYAFHSKYIAEAGPKLLKSLERIIPQPKERTKRWISTSVPESAWDTPLAKDSSAAYHVNNLLSPVLFHEGLQHVPKNAIAIEIAPTGLLQAIVKRALSKQARNVSLMKRNYADNMEFLLTNVGKLYCAGAQPQIQSIMPPISFPVGRGTPMLNSKIEWEHSQSWFYPKFELASSMGQIYVDIDLSNEDDAYLAGHTIDGRILYPATGYLLLAWKTFAKTQGMEFHKLPVIMEQIVFHRATILHKEATVRLGINFFEGSGSFEICENGSLAVSGKIAVPENIREAELNLEPFPYSPSHMQITANDVYKELRLRGYDYHGLFRGIASADGLAQSAHLQWADNWVSFMDAMLQLSIINTSLRELYLPTSIERVVINPARHVELIARLGGSTTEEETASISIPAYVYPDLSVIKSGGVEIRGMKATLTQRRPNTQSPPKLERYCFVPYQNLVELKEEDQIQSHTQALAIALQLVVENSEGAVKLKVVEVADGLSSAASVVAKTLLDLIESEPTMTAEVVVATGNCNEGAIAAALGDSPVRIVARNIMSEAVEQNCHLLYARDMLARPDKCALQHSIASIKSTGFLLFNEALQRYVQSGHKVLAEAGYVVVSEQILSESRVLVLARRAVDLQRRSISIVPVTENNFDWLEPLKKALSLAAEHDEYVYIVCQGEARYGALGLMNCLRYEQGGKNARLVYIQDPDAETFSLQSPFYAKQLQKDLMTNVLKGDTWGSYRHLRLPAQLAKLRMSNGYINALVKGDLSSFSWVESAPEETLPQQNNDHMELCHVYYAPINFRDVMVVSGKLAADALPPSTACEECILGIEFAGRDSKGRRIMAMVLSKSIATMCYTDKRMIWDIPAHWTMEEASTVPTVYSTVYYALFVRGQLQKGESILIHAGSGGVGLAAIGVALHHGAIVFTTVSSQEKRDFLLQRFPQLNPQYIGHSRSTSFEQLIMRETKGRGVDLVLNSLADDKLQASVRCLAINGRFLEIGKYDLSKNSPLGMSVFLKNTAFHGILVDSVMERDQDVFKTIAALVQEGIRNGAVRPLPTTVFSDAEVEQAFRFMASGKHMGKVVIKIRDEEVGCAVCEPTPRLVDAIPRTFLHASKSYVIVGGLGGFGLELGNWMVIRGAKNLVLTSRTGIRNGYQALMVRRWQDRGVQVQIDTNDVTTPSGCAKLLENANAMGPVGGIFNLAVVLRDALIEDLSAADYKTVCDPKVIGTKHLDEHSRAMCRQLDYFVCFSSVSCGRGNIGQSNYGLANSAMERICEQRQLDGYPGTAIQWGAVGDTGLVIEQLGDNETVIGGTLPQRMTSCLQTLDMFLHLPHPVLASMVVAEKRKTDAAAGIKLVSAIANIMGLRDLKNIKPTATLTELGMDSLMGTEIKQTLERNFDIVMSPNDIRLLTLAKLHEIDNNEVDAMPQEAVNSDDRLQMVFDKELLPLEPIVRMKSAATEDSAKNPIFFISPLEGFVTPLERLAERLDRPVYGLQCTTEAPLDTLEDLACFYLQHIRNVQLRGPYTIVGYSYGCLLAYILAIDLEQSREVTELLFLDGSPKYVNWYTASYIERHSGENNSHQADAFLLAYFAMMVGNMNIESVAHKLLNLETLEQKINKVAEMLATETKQPKDLIAETASKFCRKIYLGSEYRATAELKIPVTLIKPTENNAKIQHDYGLSEIFKNQVNIVTVDGNHRTFLLEDKSLNEIVAVMKRLPS